MWTISRLFLPTSMIICMARKTGYMAKIALVIFGLLRHIYLSCNKDELKPTPQEEDLLCVNINFQFAKLPAIICLQYNDQQMKSKLTSFDDTDGR